MENYKTGQNSSFPNVGVCQRWLLSTTNPPCKRPQTHHQYSAQSAVGVSSSFLCVHRCLSSAARLSATWPPLFAVLCSIWILLPLVVLPLILLSIILFHAKSVFQDMANPLMFPLSNRVQYLPIFIYSSESFIKPAGLFHSSPYISTFQMLLSVWVNVHISAAYSATFQTKHFIMPFFSSRFILPLNNFSFLHNRFLCHLNPAPRISFVQYSSPDIKLPKPISKLARLFHFHQLRFLIYCFHFGLCTSPLSFSHQSSYTTLLIQVIH